MLGRGCLVLLSALLLSACYPDLDWRKLASVEGRFQVLMPARSQSGTRALGGNASMALWTASARETLFGVSYTDYPDAARLHFGEARDALLRNVSGTVVEDRSEPASPRHAPAGGDTVASRVVTIDGNTRGAAGEAPRPVRVHARLHAVGSRLYQLTVIARPEILSAGDLDMFFTSFELRAN